MTDEMAKPRLLQAIDALRAGERRTAGELIDIELRNGLSEGQRWQSIARLAAQIGEIELSLEAAERFARTKPVTLERLLYYWGELATYGRADRALDEISRLPASTRENPSILHFLGTMAGQRGDFTSAEECYRRALVNTPMLPQTWFALAMIKRFESGDQDLAAMERHRGNLTQADPQLAARFLYGLAKAWYDCGNYDRAFALYDEGAALRRRAEKFDADALTRQVDQITGTFTPDKLKLLQPPEEQSSRMLFVNGLPRSGTTLVEQILVSHSKVAGGGEINALRAALIPTRDYSLAGALEYQVHTASESDPWGRLAQDYCRIVGMWFGGGGLIVDKTLSQSRLIGFLLHMLPNTPILWLRRSPADAALSCFRSFFSSGVGWSWSLADIGRFFREEDRLFEHWTRMFSDRILIVPYENLVRDPQVWIPRMLKQCGLSEEPQVYQSHVIERDVRTASVQQVRSPISTNRIGSAAAIGPYMDAFHLTYSI